MYKRILVATDGSELSRKATTAAIALAALCAAELIVVKAVPRYPPSYFEGGMTLPQESLQEIEARWLREAQQQVDVVKQAAFAQGVKATALALLSDVVSETLLRVAKEQQCDLIVMASHGRKGLQRILLGSETLQVLTHSSMAVLVLK